MSSTPRIVAIGGGTGLATLLRGLKKYPAEISAVVTMTDNGQSSGRLSRDLGTLPPGDVRQCLAALAEDEDLLAKVFEYRFTGSRGLSGHALGNLLLLALSEITGNFDKAVQESSRILCIKGKVIPSTLNHVSLLARLGNDQMALGEVDIPRRGHRFGIKEIQLVPTDIKGNPAAIEVIKKADLIVIGPGSLFTSVLPAFLIRDLRRAIGKASAQKVYICNISGERGETERFTVEDHLKTLQQYLPTKLATVIVNNRVLSSNGKEYQLGNIQNITTESKRITSVRVTSADLIDEKNPLHHDPDKLAKVIWQIAERLS